MANYDIIIIGAGIIGLSTAYTFLEKDTSLKICILEKEDSVAAHQSGHNSGVIHSGIYYKPGSLKATNCIKGYGMLLDFCSEHKVEYDICGKIIIAAEENELPSLELLLKRGIENGLSGLRAISDKEIREFEPNASGLRGIHVPQTGIIDYRIVSNRIAQLIQKRNAEIRFGEKVTGITASHDKVTVKTPKNEFTGSFLISCAGLQSDTVGKMMNNEIDFRIIPFRGEYYILNEEKKYLVNNLIYPVPDPWFPFLGVHFTRKINGTTEAGPNAILALKKEGYKKSDFNFKDAINTLGYPGFRKMAIRYAKTGFREFYRSLSKRHFVRSLQKLVPEIKSDDLIRGGSGVRAQACGPDGRLIDDFLFIECERALIVGNAPSPAATSCFSIAETIYEKVHKKNQ